MLELRALEKRGEELTVQVGHCANPTQFLVLRTVHNPHVAGPWKHSICAFVPATVLVSLQPVDVSGKEGPIISLNP
eukprot:213816-Amphidinium_carterae.3